MDGRLKQINKAMAYILRHAPWKFEVELDERNWVKIEDLVTTLKSSREEWLDLKKIEIRKVVLQCPKQRYEIQEDKIRALYGHSIPKKLLKEPVPPPNILYHGTSLDHAKKILRQGLKPMNRQYVHLSRDLDTATKVGFRRTGKPIILVINAEEAVSSGVRFYKGNDLIWLADYIPQEHIKSYVSV